MTKRFLALTLAVLSAAAVTAATLLQAQKDDAADARRLIEVLQIEQGETIAEIGAGDGALTLAIARHVGASGRVYTSELGDSALARLRAAVSGQENVQVVEGHPAHANLPEGCCDAVFMRDVYHHFEDPASMNASILRALKPGGRLAIIDFPPRNDALTAPPGRRGQREAHGIAPDVVAAELKAAGFDIVQTDDPPGRWFLVVAARPR